MARSKTTVQTEGEGTPERWTYAGIRRNSKGQRVHAWREPSGQVAYYGDTGSYVIGGIYDVNTWRTGDSTIRSAPKYTGERVPAGEGSLTEADALSDRATRTALARTAAEKRDGRADAINDAMDELRRLSRQARSRAERDALLSAAMDAIYGYSR